MTEAAVESDAAKVVLLSEDADMRRKLSAALEGTQVDLALARKPFDTALVVGSACILLDDSAAAGAIPLLECWRNQQELERPPLFVLLAPGAAPTLPADVLAEVDGVIVPAYGAGLLRRIVATALENRRLHAELDELGRFAVLGKVLAGVLHELKNPLNNVLGGMDRLDGLLAENEQLGRWREMVRRNGELLREALADLLNGFRDLPEPQPVPLHALLDRAVMFAVGGDMNYRRRISVEKGYASPAPTVRGNSGQLLHLFLNLLLNARQAFGERQGIIVLRTKWEAEGKVSVEVQDNGPGIPADVLPHLFKSRRTTKRIGSGFGLSLAREVVDRHGGSIEASNLPAGGACFRIVLPAEALS